MQPRAPKPRKAWAGTPAEQECAAQGPGRGLSKAQRCARDGRDSTRNGNNRKTLIPNPNITAVILAGGRARRMAGHDKGLIPLAGRPMIEHVIDALRPQVGELLISANRNLDDYRRYEFPVIADTLNDFQGPLAGVAAALEACPTEYLLTVPCDAPLIPADLAATLYSALAKADAAVVHDGERTQAGFALLRRSLLPNLLGYLAGGGRGLHHWYATLNPALADYAGRAGCFHNLNTPEDLAAFKTQASPAC